MRFHFPSFVWVAPCHNRMLQRKMSGAQDSNPGDPVHTQSGTGVGREERIRREAQRTPRLSGMEVLQVVERTKFHLWKNYLSFPNSFQTHGGPYIRRWQIRARRDGRGSEVEACSLQATSAVRGLPNGEHWPVLLIQTQRGAKATISLGCQSGFTEQPQSLFSYTCRQLLNYTLPPE